MDQQTHRQGLLGLQQRGGECRHGNRQTIEVPSERQGLASIQDVEAFEVVDLVSLPTNHGFNVKIWQHAAHQGGSSPALHLTSGHPVIHHIPLRPGRLCTKHPQASQPPNPSRAPTSSAEVPPNADLPPPPPPPPTEGASPATQDLSTSSSSHAYDVNAPLDLKQLLNNAYNNYALQTGVATRSGTPTENVYAKPVTGRTVFLEGRYGGAQKAGNPAGAFRVLDRLVKEQKVKRLFNQQRFHERKGMKRKRLRMERWRFRFKDGFKAAASRVLELKKQGW
ncbi:hypothetical protein V2G26_021051 [Clonostachys chloroleuca]